MAIVSPGAVIADVAAVDTVTGGVITDATRQAALAWTATQQGGSTDGATPPAGVAVWEAGTNLHRNGQCDAVTDWVTAASATVTVDATTPAPFSPQSIKVVTGGAGVQEGVQAYSGSGQAAAAGVVFAGSVYFKGVPGASYLIYNRWYNTDTTVTDSVQSNVTATGAWQQVTPATVAVAAGKTGDRCACLIRTATQRAETFWAAHGMLQTGVSVCSPYIATSQGATATRAAGDVTFPSAGLSVTQGCVIVRARLGFASTAVPKSVNGLFQWASANNVRLIAYIQSNGTLIFARQNADSAPAVSPATPAFNVGDSLTFAIAWDAGHVYGSANGAAFTSVANTSSPNLAAVTTASFGSAAPYFANSELDGTIMWAVYGAGVPSSSDLSAFAALPDVQPAVFPPTSVGVIGQWQTYRPVGPRFRKVNVADTAVIVR